MYIRTQFSHGELTATASTTSRNRWHPREDHLEARWLGALMVGLQLLLGIYRHGTQMCATNRKTSPKRVREREREKMFFISEGKSGQMIFQSRFIWCRSGLSNQILGPTRSDVQCIDFEDARPQTRHYAINNGLKPWLLCSNLFNMHIYRQLQYGKLLPPLKN